MREVVLARRAGPLGVIGRRDRDAEHALSAGTSALQELRRDTSLAGGVSALAETLLRSPSIRDDATLSPLPLKLGDLAH